MTPQEASEELKEEFEIFKDGISKADWDNPNEELKKIIEANTMAIKVLELLANADKISESIYGCVILEGYADVIAQMRELFKETNTNADSD